MSLRWKLVLLLGGLVAVLLAAQGWMIRSLTEELSQELGQVAMSVGSSVVSVFTTQLEEVQAEGSFGADESRAVTVLRTKLCQDDGDGQEVCEEEILQGPAAAAALGDVQTEAGMESSYHFQVLDDAEVEPGGDPRIHLWHHRGGAVAEDLTMRIHEDPDHSRFLLLQGPGPLERLIPLPERPLDERLERFTRRLLTGTLAIIAVGLLLAGVIAHRVSRPLAQLVGAARQVGQGELGAQVPEDAARAGGEVGAALTAFNAMSRRLAQLDQDARRLRARRHLSELGDVSRGLAHSLRNPLNALGLSLSELAGEGGSTPERDAALESAQRQIRRMDATVRSFLALASGGGSAEPTAVAPLVQDVALEALQAGTGGVRVTTELGELPPGTELSAVEPELRAVLQALVVNAVEASPEGETVTVHAAPAGENADAVEIQVLDRGPGIVPELRPKLFTPHATTKPHGAGMGLYLARRIAEDRYGGELHLGDRPGGGTVARLVLGSRQDSPAGDAP